MGGMEHEKRRKSGGGCSGGENFPQEGRGGKKLQKRIANWTSELYQRKVAKKGSEGKRQTRGGESTGRQSCGLLQAPLCFLVAMGSPNKEKRPFEGRLLKQGHFRPFPSGGQEENAACKSQGFGENKNSWGLLVLSARLFQEAIRLGDTSRKKMSGQGGRLQGKKKSFVRPAMGRRGEDLKVGGGGWI